MDLVKPVSALDMESSIPPSSMLPALLKLAMLHTACSMPAPDHRCWLHRMSLAKPDRYSRMRFPLYFRPPMYLPVIPIQLSSGHRSSLSPARIIFLRRTCCPMRSNSSYLLSASSEVILSPASSYVGAVGRHNLTFLEANPGDPSLCLYLSNPANVAPNTHNCGPRRRTESVY